MLTDRFYYESRVSYCDVEVGLSCDRSCPRRRSNVEHARHISGRIEDFGGEHRIATRHNHDVRVESPEGWTHRLERPDRTDGLIPETAVAMLGCSTSRLVDKNVNGPDVKRRGSRVSIVTVWPRAPRAVASRCVLTSAPPT